MAIDVSNLVNILATQPVQQMQNLGASIEEAQMYREKKKQQDYENYRNAVKDAFDRQIKEAQLNESQIKTIESKAKIVAGVAGNLLTIKDPLVRQQVYEDAIPTLKSVGMTDEQITNGRGLLGDDNALLGKVAEGQAASEVYKQYTTQEKGAYKVGQVENIPWKVDGKPGVFVGQYVGKDYQEPDAPAGFKELSKFQKGDGSLVTIYGEKAAQEFTKSAVKQIEEAGKQATAARRANASMAVAEKALEGMNTGNLSSTKLALGQMASSLGIKVGDISNMEAAKGAYSDLVKAQLSQFTGAISEGERAYAIEVSPNLAMSPEGRKKLASLLKETNDRVIEYHRQMDRYIKENKTMNLYKEGAPSFQENWDKYMEEHPLSIMSEEAPKITSDQWGSSKQAIKMGDIEYRNIGGKWMDRTGKEYKSGK